MYPTVYWGELLRDLRVQHFMLQKEVAILLHISRQSYCNLENGRTQPTPEQLAALSFIYDVNLLDYVRKCIPPSFVAEQLAYRSIQSRRVYEVRLEEEEKQKKMAGSKSAHGKDPINGKSEDEKPEKKPEAARESTGGKNSRKEEIPGLPPDAPFTSPIPVRIERKKRDSPTMYHNTSNMSSVELLMSGKYPRPAKISEEALLGRLSEEEKTDVPKRKRGRPRKNRSSEENPAGDEDVSGKKSAGSPDGDEAKSEPSAGSPDREETKAELSAGSPDKEETKAELSAGSSGPMPPELLRELFPQESPYGNKNI